MPCGWMSTSLESQFSARYPQYVWHKSKRLMPENVLEDHWEALEERHISLECSAYLAESVDQILETTTNEKSTEKTD
jgi:uncharacterized protein YaaW (UPF0174 family)